MRKFVLMAHELAKCIHRLCSFQEGIKNDITMLQPSHGCAQHRANVTTCDRYKDFTMLCI